MLGLIDKFFCDLEGTSTSEAVEKKPTGSTSKNEIRRRGLGSLLYSLFVSKDYQDRGLAGWKDDKEKFKIDLLNDIKTFLFTKWEKPWTPSLIFDTTNKIISGFRNVTGRVYHNSSNIISLERKCGESPYFITIAKLEKEGGKIIDKSKVTSVISYIPIFKDDKVKAVSGDDERKPDFMMPRFHNVINVDFTEGIKKPKYKTIEFKHLELNEYIENFLDELKKRKRIPKLIYDQADGCHYQYSLDFTTDEIHLVKIDQFKDIASYYSTLFHEITHSTKASTRLGVRDKKNNIKLEYANEELVAEMGALILCSELGLEYTRQNSLSYLKGWLDRTKGNSDDAMIEAYAFACDAADYLLEGIDLEALVPKAMVKRAEENKTEPEPGKAKPDGDKTISTDKGKEKEPEKEVEKPKDKATQKDEPEGGRNTDLSEVDKIIEQLISNADTYRNVELTNENFVKEFSAKIDNTIKEGYVNTPLGWVKIDIKQIRKLEEKERVQFFGLIKPTLENPLLIVKSKDANGFEREAFIKTFTDGKTIFFVSFVKTDENLSVVSNHSRRESQIKKILSSGSVVYKNNRITALSGLTNNPEPTYKTLLIGLNLESLGKDKQKLSQSQPEKNYYIINEDRKVEMYFDIEDYKKLPETDKKEVKRYFLWSRFKKAWISKAKDSYHVESFAKRLGLVFYEKKKRRSFEDELQRKKDNAERNTGKYATRAEKATKRAEDLQSSFNRLRKDWSWLTQPIIRGHSGSERFGRSRQRVVNNYAKGFEEYNKAEYYKQKEKLAEETLKDAKLKDIHYVQNRVKDAEKSIRKISEWVARYQNDVETKTLTDEQKEKNLDAIDEGLQKLQYNYDKLAYYKLAESAILESNTGNKAVVFDKALSQKLAKFLKKHFSKLYKTDILSTTSNHFITVRNPKDLPVELRKSVAAFIYPDQIERINEGHYDIGSIRPTFISEYPIEWHKYLLSTGVNFLDDGNNPTPEKPSIKSTEEKRADLKSDIEKGKNYQFKFSEGEPVQDIETGKPYMVLSKYFENGEPRYTVYTPGKKGSKAYHVWIKESNLVSRNSKPTSNTVEIVDFPVNNLYTDEKRFQNRKAAFSEDSMNRIIKAVKDGSFSWAKFDPITRWTDPENGKNYILSGHSRLASFKEMNKQGLTFQGFDFSTIPSRLFEGSESQAVNLALNSNTLSTKETEVERAMYYNRQRSMCEMKTVNGLGFKNECEKEVETACREAEGKNANFILNLSYLDPEGYLVETLSRLGAEKDNDSTNVLRTVANWVGEARRRNHELTSEQEKEIALFLLNGGYGNKPGQFRNKEQFNERLEYSFSKWKFRGAKPGDPLNLANTLSKSPFEREYDERLAKAKQAYDEAIQEHEEKYNKYLMAVMDGKLTQARMDELMKPLIAWVTRAKGEYERVRGQKDDVKKAADAQTTLFGHSGHLFGFKNIGSIIKSKAYKLSRDLGKFIGGYERMNYSIVLRGDKGAGKTRLLYQLIDLFASHGLKIGFMSLEMSSQSSVSQGYKKEYIKDKNIPKIEISDEPLDYDSLNAICKLFDVVAIDSWTKLKGLKQDDFDRLQKENPSTILLVVFQSTTGKVTRGGNMPEFDAAIVIHVHEGGVAVCEKNRYANIDSEYLVFEQKLRVEEPTEAD